MERGSIIHPDSYRRVNSLESYRPKPAQPVQQLQQSLYDAFKIYPRTTSKGLTYYKSVQVIFLSWTSDPSMEITYHSNRVRDRLRELFERTYHYRVVDIQLSVFDEDPGTTMKTKLSTLLTGQTKDDLTIIYYYGPDGTADLEYVPSQESTDTIDEMSAAQNTEFFMSGQRPNGSFNRASFNPIRRDLIDSHPSNILMLLDCCYSSTASIGQGKELIAACGVGSGTPVGDQGFSWNLAQVLEHAAANHQVLTTAHLYALLVQRSWLIDSEQNPLLETTPVHVNRAPGATAPIILAPLDQKRLDPNHQPLGSNTILGPARVVLEVHIESNRHLDVFTLNRQFSDHVGCHAEVVSVFPSKSCCAIIRVSTELWYWLLPHPAYRFVCFEGRRTPAVNAPSHPEFVEDRVSKPLQN